MGGEHTRDQVRITCQTVQNASSRQCAVIRQQSRHDLRPVRQPAVSRLILFQFSGIARLSKRQGLAKAQHKTFVRNGVHASRGMPANTMFPRTRLSLQVAVTAPGWTLLEHATP